MSGGWSQQSRIEVGSRLARQGERSYTLPPGIRGETAIEYAYGTEVAFHDWLDVTLAERNDDESGRLLNLLVTYRRLFRDVTQLNVHFGDGRNRLASRTLAKPEAVMLAPDGTEALLHVAQFLGVISSGLNRIAAAGPKRSAAMDRFVEVYLPLVATHLNRWTAAETGPFQNRAAGCPQDRRTAVAFLQEKLQARERGKPAACSILNDLEMWLVFVAVNVLAATNHEPAWRDNLPNGLSDRLRDLVAAGAALVEVSLLPTELLDWQGQRRNGAVIDLAGRQDDDQYRFAGYTGDRYPEPGDARQPPDLSWDLAHAARLPRIVERLADAGPDERTRGRFREIAVRLANQFAYRMFEGDLARPRFFNFSSGANGWYRVDYDGRRGFAYPPFAMSAGLLQTGFLRLARFNPDVGRIGQAVLVLLQSKDDATCTFARSWYGSSFMLDRAPVQNGLFKPGGAELALPFVATLSLR